MNQLLLNQMRFSVVSRVICKSHFSTSKVNYIVPGALHLVSTPIGCLDDISTRAKTILQFASMILAEDTRTTGLLLNRMEISNKLESLNQENERSKIPMILTHLKDGRRCCIGKSIALVSDAGTPVLSDPGATLVRTIPIVPVPGPSAALAALVCSGFYITPFQFVGFVKRSGSERSRQLRTIAASPSTTILYESSHRICETLDDLAGTLGGDRRVCICRELTKLHETITRLSLQEKGEFTLVLEGLTEFNERMNQKDEEDKNSIYRCIQEMKREGINKDVIMRIMTNSFQLTKSEVKKELYS
ncbi:16s rRNA methyltransferase [Blastocystis sp. subtype 4]|uniref:16s rRNA methyltransferase n=1 Tax=Blastocystis sp. subtype 4 TaxID=944170 RepID=UPI000712195F|nr:16s rRNA methyltransferase [Blastocystis sp. subtype 4]KNB44780.1 16s rRNA methyltransferase [Blastocystis sp. subtype 4]|eukprot:XP_014528203.1 16s rRNA methyltransferase [Blastocystis sp. subtype 4]